MLFALYVKHDNQCLLAVFLVAFHLVPTHAHNVHFMMTTYRKKHTIVMIVESAVSVGEKIISTVPPVVPATLLIYGIITYV